METGSHLTSRLAIIGTAVLALVFVVLVSSARVLVHPQAAAAYLAIAGLELSPFALVGGSLLVAAALRARSHRVVVTLGLASALASMIAVYGRRIPDGWSFVTGLVITYWLGLALALLGGAWLASTLVVKERAAARPMAGRG